MEELQKIYQEAVSLHSAGDPAAAIVLYNRIIEQLPDADLVLYNLGLAYYDLGQYQDAVTAYQQCVELTPDDPDSWFNLGLTRKQMGQFSRAETAYKKALQLRPDDPDTLYNLGRCCQDAHRIDEAVDYYQQVLEIDPTIASAVNNLAYLCHYQGRFKEAERLYQQLLELRPDHPSAQHMLAALQGEGAAAPPREYVRDLFDQFSANFEQHLVENLQYRVPTLLWELFSSCLDAKKYHQVLDLGCGTGLAGAVFRPACTRLTGIDLSVKMVEVAEKKGIYEELAVVDILDYLNGSSNTYDLIIAADVLTYLGDLEPLFKAVATANGKAGVFCFSVEQAEQKEWALRPTGRYAHALTYIESLAAACGYRVRASQQARLRRERDNWIEGRLFVLEKM